MAWVPGNKRLRANTAQGSPGIYGRLEPVPKSELAIRWLNHQCRRVPKAIETRCTISLGSVEGVDQSQESKSAVNDESTRWNALIVSSDTESCVGPQTHTDCKID